jgi:threonylcarbamoyladenosine tRNA methylthiotransferase MtaB
MRPVLFEQERKGQWMQGYTDNYIRVSAPYNPLWINRIVPVELASVEADGTVLCRLNASDQLMAEDHFVFQP